MYTSKNASYQLFVRIRLNRLVNSLHDYLERANSSDVGAYDLEILLESEGHPIQKLLHDYEEAIQLLKAA